MTVSDIIIKKYILEVHTYPNGESFIKHYPIGKPSKKTTKQKKKVEKTVIDQEQEVLF